ncbi:MAG: Cholesterol 25-hydroxylase-like protein [Heterodermia speciosa]|uniref:Cholesterol 25-hydroxylase-like protein n=1 Tax=Heterodermia speciosa TaxID=116794 RepID=A0A8H3IRV3_9LECA|nr:MAG: Cholesterol 25-hydroxylase-like protein [Heterodermia speciosa]
MWNTTNVFNVSSTPSCTLVAQSPLIPGISDAVLSTFLPTVVYIIASGFFYWLDRQELFTQYRIHPTEEDLQRNHVSRFQCFQGVARYHLMQISIGLFLAYGVGPDMVGSKSCDVHRWAVRIRRVRSLIPLVLLAFGVDVKGLAVATSGKIPALAQFLAGPGSSGSESSQAHITSGELRLADFVESFLVPTVQFLVALAVVDTWIYFTHRLCHINQTLYRIVHSQHHRLYVPYAYGAVYAHWLESLFLDILSFIMGNALAGFSVRQSMVFGSLATIKTISDHCGYVFSWDPFRFLNANGAKFHDLHHQSWGFKNNFSTYTVFWDNILGTTWTNEEAAAARYSWVQQKTKERVEKKSIPMTTKAMERE